MKTKENRLSEAEWRKQRGQKTARPWKEERRTTERGIEEKRTKVKETKREQREGERGEGTRKKRQ